MNRLTGPLTVAIWGCVNLVLFLVLVGFGAWSSVIALFAGSVTLIFLIAFAALLTKRRRPGPRWRRPRNADSILILAASVLAAGLAWAFYWELAPVAALPLLIALRREITSRRERSAG